MAEFSVDLKHEYVIPIYKVQIYSSFRLWPVCFITDNFSGPGRAVSAVCVWTRTFELQMTFHLDVWHAGLP